MLYNRIAGTNVERLAALSDGVFAVAMTLLVLDLHAPAADLVRTDGQLASALLNLVPKLLVYLLSFITLGIFWVGQQTQLNHLARSNRDIAWMHLAFLFAVSLMPFSTALMAAFLRFRVALVIYWFNILLLGGLMLLGWRCAAQSGLLRADMPPGTDYAVQRRIIVAQALYGAAALLCMFDPLWALGGIVLVQLNYAVAPRLPWHLNGERQ
jgi:uncharacterized membrane protein